MFVLSVKTNSKMIEHFVKRCCSSAPPRMPKCDFKPQKYTGPSLEELLNIRKTNLSPALTTHFGKPLALHQGHKQWLFDINGKRYLDMFGGICTVSVGHSHPKISEAVSEQIKKLGHVSNVYLHEKIHEYAKRLMDKLPGNLKVVYFVNSGSEANDLAILMARVHTRNSDLLSFKNCYHGMSYQTMSLTANAAYKYPVAQTGGTHHVTNPDVYQGPWGGSNCRDSPAQTSRKCNCVRSNCSAKDGYISDFKDIFKYDIRKGNLAAFFAESIQGVGGVVQYPKGYLQEAHRIVKENGGLFVSDEVQTGFGRTGDNFWGFEMHGIQPDVVTMAKGIGNGYPLAAVVTTPEIAESLKTASHFNTFGGNPIACTVGVSVLDALQFFPLQLKLTCLQRAASYFLAVLTTIWFRYSPPVHGHLSPPPVLVSSLDVAIKSLYAVPGRPALQFLQFPAILRTTRKLVQLTVKRLALLALGHVLIFPYWQYVSTLRQNILTQLLGIEPAPKTAVNSQNSKKAQEEGLQQNCKQVGTHLLLELEKLKSNSSNVGDVRGKGLMIGVELVENAAEDTTPLSGEKFMKVWDTCKDLGVIMGRGGISNNVLRIKPPMCVTKEDADFTVNVLADALKEIQSK